MLVYISLYLLFCFTVASFNVRFLTDKDSSDPKTEFWAAFIFAPLFLLVGIVLIVIKVPSTLLNKWIAYLNGLNKNS